MRLAEAWGTWGVLFLYKTCASPRLGGLGGRHSRLQNLRLAEAWGTWGSSYSATNLAPRRGLGDLGVVMLGYKTCTSPRLGGSLRIDDL
ncbi:MAG: hypothetical protein ACK4GN_02525 [Runella sp.]